MKIEGVMPKDELDEELLTENINVVIPAEGFMEDSEFNIVAV